MKLIQQKIRTGILFFSCFLLVGCSSNDYIDNEEMITSIDTLKVSKVITKVETDSTGNILDTLLVEQLKYDIEGRRRYREAVFWYKGKTNKGREYFKTNEDLFYREGFENEGKLSFVFEAKSNKKNRVVRAIQTDVNEEKIDTFLMKYFRSFYPNGKVKQVLIKSFVEDMGEWDRKTSYNRNGKVSYAVTLWEHDTINYQTWEYTDTILNKSIYTNYQFDTTKMIFYYGGTKELFKEEKLNFRDGAFIKTEETIHLYDESGERIQSIEKNQETKKTRYIKYLVEE